MAMSNMVHAQMGFSMDPQVLERLKIESEEPHKDSIVQENGSGKSIIKKHQVTPTERKIAAGVGSLIGVFTILLGGGLYIGSSFPKCEKGDGIISFSVGPCNDSGPSTGGQIAGGVLALSGVGIIITSLASLGGGQEKYSDY